MPTFSNSPPLNPRGHSLPLIRIGPAKPSLMVATSEDLIGCNTHFYGGRTVPCEEPSCKPCSEGHPFRWHAYIGVFDPSTCRQAILETTATAAVVLVEYRLTHGTLRGCMIRGQRANYSRNSRVILTCTPADQAKINLPKPPNLESILSIIWSIPTPAFRANGKGGLSVSHETISATVDAGRCLPIGPYAEAIAHKLLTKNNGN